MTFAALFPGQLSEKAGMGEALAARHPAVAKLFDEVSRRSGVDVAATFFGDGSPLLHEDRHAQVGVFAVSLAALDVLTREHGLAPAAVAGYSLGTYAACVAAGALDRWHALDLLLRVEELLRGSPVEGGMGYTIGLARPELERLIAEVSARREVLSIGNENAAQQFVVTGETWAVEQLVALAAPSALRAEVLPLRWPMHSPRLESLTGAVAAFVRRLPVRAPSRAALYAPMLGRRVDTAEDTAEVLARQIARPSRWEAVLREVAASGLHRFAEVGPGDILSRMLRWTVRAGRCTVLEDPDGIAAFAAGAAPVPPAVRLPAESA